jgi:hypothetical protein
LFSPEPLCFREIGVLISDYPEKINLKKNTSTFDAVKNTVKAAAAASGFISEGSYTSAKGNIPEVTIGAIEQKNINYEGPLRNPIIVIHGFLGANLRDCVTDKNVWGEFNAQDVIKLSKERMHSLAIPMQQDALLNDLSDSILPNGMLDTVKVKFYKYTYEQKAYINLINVLQEGGYHSSNNPAVIQGKRLTTLFSFAYDWRRDLQWNATKLHEFIQIKKSYLQESYERLYGVKNYDVKFDIMGHSMGGLLARYYLRFGIADLPELDEEVKVSWKGAENLHNVFLLGTPNAGYTDTLLELTRGIEIPPAPPALIGTWPAFYQMIPNPIYNSVIYAHNPDTPVNLFDLNVWIKMKWGLADPNQADIIKEILPDIKSASLRRDTAIEHLGKCLKRAERFIRVMSIKAQPPPYINLFLVLGNAVRTTDKLILNEENGSLKVFSYAPGDGKVTKASALFDERTENTWTHHFRSPIAWDNITLLRAAHMGITTDPSFKDNVLFMLTNQPIKRKLL